MRKVEIEKIAALVYGHGADGVYRMFHYRVESLKHSQSKESFSDAYLPLGSYSRWNGSIIFDAANYNAKSKKRPQIYGVAIQGVYCVEVMVETSSGGEFANFDSVFMYDAVIFRSMLFEKHVIHSLWNDEPGTVYRKMPMLREEYEAEAERCREIRREFISMSKDQ